MQARFGARLLPRLIESLMLSSGHVLDFHAVIVSVPPVGILEV